MTITVTQHATLCVFGAGLSGVLMGMQLKRAGFHDFVIYEKQPDVGGTWYRNTWPGLHCDVPSHLYCATFEPNPEWTMAFAGQREILSYVRRCAERYGLLDHLRLDTCVDKATWNATGGHWDIETAAGETARHRIVVSATGGLTEPNFPRIAGLDRFAGAQWHSGAWRDDIDLRGLRVAVVGTAASAVQIVPVAAARAKEVYVFQRSPNWVMPRHNVAFTASQKRAFRDDATRKRYWRRLYRGSYLTYRAFQRKPAAIEAIRAQGLKHMRAAIDDPEMIAKLTPTYEPGCKRIVVSDEYYPALARPHVHLVTQPVTALTHDAVVAADGSSTRVDVVIFCTGYRLGARADGRPAVDVRGRDGQRLSDALMRRPESYRGVAVPGFPNYFTVCGLNGVAAYTSLFASAELACEFIGERTKEIVTTGVKSMEVRADATGEYNDAIQTALQKMSWATGGCTNFYRDSQGRVLSFYPYTLGRLRRELRQAGSRDFVLEHFRTESTENSGIADRAGYDP